MQRDFKLSTPTKIQKTVINWRIKEWFPDLNEATQVQLKNYHNELIKFNKIVSLISSKTAPHADAIHFADSIISSRLVRKMINKNVMLFDLGSGNGFPGLIYGLLYSDQNVTLIDSDERKCEFLRHVVAALRLSNVQVENKKIEALPPDSIQQAICRGYASLPRALLSLRKKVKKGGQVFHLKADEWSIEVSQIPTQLCSAWRPTLEFEYELPVGDIKLNIVRTERISGT
jgi:16S rRNA (guanine527-N7)-methyltransferase